MNTGKAARQQHLLHGRRTRRQRLKKFVRTPRFLSVIGLVLCFGLVAPPKFISGRVFMSLQTPNPAQLDNAAARQRVKNFLTAWLIHRDQLETLTLLRRRRTADRQLWEAPVMDGIDLLIHPHGYGKSWAGT